MLIRCYFVKRDGLMNAKDLENQKERKKNASFKLFTNFLQGETSNTCKPVEINMKMHFYESTCGSC